MPVDKRNLDRPTVIRQHMPEMLQARKGAVL